jgi:hypothetical protein
LEILPSGGGCRRSMEDTGNPSRSFHRPCLPCRTSWKSGRSGESRWSIHFAPSGDGAVSSRVPRPGAEFRRKFCSRPGPLCWTTYEDRETGPAHPRSWPISASSLLRGSRPWNSRIRFSSVLIAALISSSPRVSSFFSTTRISRTTPSAASSARRSAPTAVRA